MSLDGRTSRLPMPFLPPYRWRGSAQAGMSTPCPGASLEAACLAAWSANWLPFVMSDEPH